MDPTAARPDVFFGLRAAVDVSSARKWYELQRVGLGDRFLRCLAQCIATVGSNPEAAMVVHPGVRRALMRPFPFGVFYAVNGNAIVILAVVHTRRHPDAWLTDP